MTRQTSVFRLEEYRAKPRTVYFNRPELNELLALYSRHVIRGIWRDYAIDHGDGQAIFSVFRHTHESAAYRVVKRVASGGRAGDFTVFAGLEKVASGANLRDALDIFRRKPWLVSGRR